MHAKLSEINVFKVLQKDTGCNIPTWVMKLIFDSSATVCGTTQLN